MHPADIQAALKKARITQLDIAQQLDVSPSAVSAVIKGRISSRQIRGYISQVLELDENALWPPKHKPTLPKPILPPVRAASQ